MSSFLFHNTIIPIQVTFLGVHHRPHGLPQTMLNYNPYSANLAGCEGFGHASTH